MTISQPPGSSVMMNSQLGNPSIPQGKYSLEPDNATGSLEEPSYQVDTRKCSPKREANAGIEEPLLDDMEIMHTDPGSNEYHYTFGGREPISHKDINSYSG